TRPWSWCWTPARRPEPAQPVPPHIGGGRPRWQPNAYRSARCAPRSSPLAAALAETRRVGFVLPDRRPPDASARRSAASARPAVRAQLPATSPRRRVGTGTRAVSLPPSGLRDQRESRQETATSERGNSSVCDAERLNRACLLWVKRRVRTGVRF